MDKIKSAYVRTVAFFKFIFAAIFGNLNWQPPTWLRKIFSAVDAALFNTRLFVKASPVRAAGVVILVAALGGGSYFGYLWYKNRPQPQRFTFTLDSLPMPPAFVEKPEISQLQIGFSGSVADISKVGKKIKSGISLEPKIEGEWTWVTDKTLRFLPNDHWPVGQGYRVSFSEELFASHIKLEKYSEKFQTPGLTYSVKTAEFYQDPTDAGNKRVSSSLGFNYAIDPKDFENSVEIKLFERQSGRMPKDGRPLRTTVTFNKFKSEAYVLSDIVQIPNEDSEIVVTYRGEKMFSLNGRKPGAGTNSRNIPIPGKSDFFKVRETSINVVRNEKYDPEFVLTVETTADAVTENFSKFISMWVLPIYVDPQTKKEQPNRMWSPAEVSADLLNRSTKIKYKIVPSEFPHVSLHPFKIDVKQGQQVYVKVDAGAKAFGDYEMFKKYDNVLRVPDLPKELNIMHDGGLLTLTGEKKLNVISRGIPGIELEMARVLPDQINHLITQTNGKFQARDLGTYGSLSSENISEIFTDHFTLGDVSLEKANYTTIDFKKYLGEKGGVNKGMFLMQVRGWNPQDKSADWNLSDKRLVLITDLGLIAKVARDGTHTVFIQSLATGKPLAGVKVEILGKNGLPILTETTNADGRVDFPNTNNYTREKNPIAYFAKRGVDVAFLPVGDYDRRLDFGRFNVGGIQLDNQTMDQLRGFMFTERGLYRPGDEVNLAWIVKNWSWSKKLAGIPLEVTITNPKGALALQQKVELSKEGFGDLQFQTEYTSPTGTYTASLYLIKDKNQRDLIGSAQFKVEEFVPDRMKISLKLSREKIKGWTSLETLQAQVALMNLFGMPAEKRRVVSKLSLSPYSPHFKEYEDYYFVDPHQTDKSFDVTLEESETDEKGESNFDIDLSKYNAATYRLQLTTQGYEAEGGRSVTAQAGVIVSPLKYLVGFKADQSLGYIKKESVAKIGLVAIDPDLKQIAVTGLKKKLMRIEYVNVLARQADGTLRYQSVKKEVSVSEKPLDIAVAGTEFDVETSQPGNFVYVLLSPENKEVNKIFFTVAGSANLTRSLDRNAELQVKLSKEDINPGESLEFQIVAPYAGAGLITIEREKVFAQKWFVSDKNATTQTIKVPENLEGGGYINIFWLRAQTSPEIFMNPLSFATIPFQINRDRRMQKIKLEVPDLVKPGNNLDIKYSSNRNSKIIIYGVDEGILQVAKYQTPDPLAFFFQKVALQVQTYQILDLLLPEFSIVKKLLSPGGDEGSKALAANLNPFKRKTEKPVVFWSGIIDVTPVPKTFSYQVPDYFNGQIRIMAIAANEESIGRQTQKTTVRGDMVISPNVPFFTSPGDEFDISVGVTNALVGSGEKAKIDFTLNMSEHFELVQKPETTLAIPEGREGVVKAKIKTKNNLGVASITFVATQGASRASYTSSLSVRPAVSYMTTLTGGYSKDSSIEVPTPRQMYPHFRKLEFGVSLLPLGLGHGLRNYLDEYPHGCTEQITSRAFPAVALGKKPDFGYDQIKVEKSVANAIQNLRARQNTMGSFLYWPGYHNFSDFTSVYAAHYLTEARSAGYQVPQDIIARTLEYLATVSNFNTATLHSARIWAYAIYLQARNGYLPTNDLNRLRQEIEKKYPKEWQKDLAGLFLAATYKIMKQDDEAIKLIAAFDLAKPRDFKGYDYFYDGTIADAYALFLLAKHFPDKLSKEGLEVSGRIADKIVKNQYNTISTAISLLAFGAMADQSNATSLGEDGAVEVNEYTLSGQKKNLLIPKGLFPKMNFNEGSNRLKIENPNKLSLFYLATQGGFDNQQPAKVIKEGAEIIHEIMDEKGNKISSLKLGEEAYVHLRVRSLNADYLQNIAVVDLLPSGFELVLDERLKAPQHEQDSPESEGTDSEGHSDVDGPMDGEGEGEIEGEGGARFSLFPKVFAQDSASLSRWSPDYVDMREDRVVIYGTIRKNLLEYVYKIKATNRGSFVVPAAFLEHMYDKTIHARSLPDKITVIDPK